MPAHALNQPQISMTRYMKEWRSENLHRHPISRREVLSHYQCIGSRPEHYTRQGIFFCINLGHALRMAGMNASDRPITYGQYLEDCRDELQRARYFNSHKNPLP